MSFLRLISTPSRAGMEEREELAFEAFTSASESVFLSILNLIINTFPRRTPLALPAYVNLFNSEVFHIHIFIGWKKWNENKIIINPKIISKKGMAKYWEACLSCLDNMGLVTRPYEIELEYYDINGKRIREKFIGFESTVISHELDHLDGILHIDIAEEIINMPKEERKQFRIEHPYEIISKDCKYEIKKVF